MVVPLGKRSVTGIVVDPAGGLDTGQTPPDKIKSILEVLDDEAFLPGDVVDLALWVAEYYACGAGDALAAAVPSTQAHKTIRIAVLTAQGHDQNIATKGRQKEAIELLRGSPGGMPVPDLNCQGHLGRCVAAAGREGVDRISSSAHRARSVYERCEPFQWRRFRTIES